MSQATIDMIMDKYEERGILARRPYPPVDLPDVYSQLGGLPDLLSQTEWPRASDGRPLHFLARIDCAELPETRGPLPATGVLQFFARIDGEMDWPADSTGHARVLHYETRRGVTTPPPDDLGRIEGGWHDYDREMRLPTEPERRVFPRWPLVFESIRTWPILAPFDLSCEVDGEDYMVAVDRARAAEIVRTTGWPIKAPLDPDWGQQAFDKDGRKVVTLPGPFSHKEFPQAWILIDRVAWAMAGIASKEQERMRSDSGDAKTRSGADRAVLLADYERIGQRATAWVLRAIEAGVDEPTPETISKEFMEWLSPLSADDRFEIRYLVMRSVERGMSAAVKYCGGSRDAAAIVPVGYMNCLEDEHSLTEVDTYGIAVAASRRWIETKHHQLLGHAPTSQDIGSRSSEDVLLLQLVSDRGVDFMFCDCGEMQFWIDADDLVAKRFDRVRANVQGG